MAYFDDPESFRAHACLERQLREHEFYVCSLDELWRECGLPWHLSPALWLRRVQPVVKKLSLYIGAVDPECRLLEDGPRSAVWLWPGDLEPRGDWQVGDILAIPPVGHLYALDLDTRPGKAA